MTTRPGAAVADPRRWLALTIIAAATLMVVLDASTLNIALPQAQTDLRISDANRHWVVTAYALAFGGLLLLGGRVADCVGRKRIFLIGLIGFALASALGGFAGDAATLYLLVGSGSGLERDHEPARVGHEERQREEDGGDDRRRNLPAREV